MTTIAWDGVTLAADRQVTTHRGFRIPPGSGMTKIFRHSDYLIGFAGIVEHWERYRRHALTRSLAQILEDNLPPEARLEESQFDVLIIGFDSQVYTDTGGLIVPSTANFTAIGSGAECAIGALAAGARAERAVAIAARYDTQTGEAIDLLRLPPLKSKPKRKITI